jgi:ParB/RepB/Spo0J family partition protein
VRAKTKPPEDGTPGIKQIPETPVAVKNVKGAVIQYYCNGCHHEWRAHPHLKKCVKCGSEDLERKEAMSAVESGRRHLNGQPASAPIASADVSPAETSTTSPMGVAKAEGRKAKREGRAEAAAMIPPPGKVDVILGHATDEDCQVNWGCDRGHTWWTNGVTHVCPLPACASRNVSLLPGCEISEPKWKKEAKAKKVGETKPSDRETEPPEGGTKTWIEIDLSKIDPSPDNPRKSFPAKELEELATSIETQGLQQPIEVLPANAEGRHELVDGERRFRALQILAEAHEKGDRWRRVRAVIKPLSREEARDYRLATFVRAGLNPIEQARAFEARLAAGGITQEQLGKIVGGLKQGTIANKLHLLKAPENLQAKLISGEMGERLLRELLRKFADVPEVLQEWGQQVRKEDLTGRDFDDVRYECEAVLDEMFPPLHTSGWNAVKFKVTPEIESELGVFEFGNQRHVRNAQRFRELVADAERKKSARADRPEKKRTAAEQKAIDQKQAEIFQKRLYRYKVAWLQKRCIARLSAGDVAQPILLRLALHFAVESQSTMARQEDLRKAITASGAKAKKSGDSYFSRFADYPSLLGVDDKKLWGVCQAALAAFIGHAFDGYHSGFEPKEIEGLAGELGIDIRKEWLLDMEYLELHTGAQLVELAREWKVIAVGDKRSQKIKSLWDENTGRAAKFACPKELVDVKAVQLS